MNTRGTRPGLSPTFYRWAEPSLTVQPLGTGRPLAISAVYRGPDFPRACSSSPDTDGVLQPRKSMTMLDLLAMEPAKAAPIPERNLKTDSRIAWLPAYPGSWRDRLDRWTVVRPVDRWRRQLLEWSDAIYTTSKLLLPTDLQAAAQVVVNGVDTVRFRPDRRGASTGPLRCVYVSSFRSWHGAEHLVRGASAINCCYPAIISF